MSSQGSYSDYRQAAARGEPARARMLHEVGCPASDDGLARLYRAGMS